MLEEYLYRSEARIYRLIKGSVFLYRLATRPAHAGKALVDAETDLCLEGFPRSANTYAYQLLKVSNPQFKIAHHTHSIANIKLALKYRIPTFVLIRAPIDALTSAVIRRNSIKQDNDTRHLLHAIEMYGQFYSFVLRNMTNINIVEFSTVIKSPLKFISCVKAGCKFPVSIPENASELENTARSNMEYHQKIIGESFSASSLPDPYRDILKSSIRSRLENWGNEVDNLKLLYERLIDNRSSSC